MPFSYALFVLILFGPLLSRNVSAIYLQLNDTQSIRDAAGTAAFGMMSLYAGSKASGIPGKWAYPPYYWWEDGHAWDGLIHYRHFTRDTQYDSLIMNALTSQLGPADDYNNPNEAFDEGNDDQAFWVFAALSAFEYGLPTPPAPIPSWLQIAVNAFNDYVHRWDHTSCGGGLKWQYHKSNAGYDYK